MKNNRKMEDMHVALSVLSIIFIFMALILKQISYDSFSCIAVFVATALVAVVLMILDIILKKSYDAILVHFCILIVCFLNLI